jgi:hypothetical protein
MHSPYLISSISEFAPEGVEGGLKRAADYRSVLRTIPFGASLLLARLTRGEMGMEDTPARDILFSEITIFWCMVATVVGVLLVMISNVVD